MRPRSPSPPMPTLLVHTSRLRALRLALMSAALAAVSFWMSRGVDESSLRGAGRLFLGGGRAVVIGWIGTDFFGLGTVVALRQMLERGPRLTIDERGLTDRSGGATIAWREVRGLSLVHVQQQPFLALELANEERYLASLSAWRRRGAQSNRAFGFPACAISIGGLRMSPEAIVDAARDAWRAHGPTTA